MLDAPQPCCRFANESALRERVAQPTGLLDESRPRWSIPLLPRRTAPAVSRLRIRSRRMSAPSRTWKASPSRSKRRIFPPSPIECLTASECSPCCESLVESPPRPILDDPRRGRTRRSFRKLAWLSLERPRLGPLADRRELASTSPSHEPSSHWIQFSSTEPASELRPVG